MPEGYTVTPQPVAGQQGSAWIRWLGRYAHEHAAAVAQMTVRDFPAWVLTVRSFWKFISKNWKFSFEEQRTSNAGSASLWTTAHLAGKRP